MLKHFFVWYQAPPGVKKNLLRTYESWSPTYVSKSGLLARSQALFALSWFHAVVQERRNYIPQASAIISITIHYLFPKHHYVENSPL